MEANVKYFSRGDFLSPFLYFCYKLSIECQISIISTIFDIGVFDNSPVEIG